jgi:hypothetical protein
MSKTPKPSRPGRSRKPVSGRQQPAAKPADHTPVRRVLSPPSSADDSLADALEVAAAGGTPTLPEGVYLVELDITYDLVEDRPPMPPAVRDQYDDLHALVNKSPAKAVARLEKLVAEWPDVPQLTNLLNVSYGRTNRLERCERLTEDAFVRFPDYFFARVNFAQLLIDRDQVEAVLPAMGGDFHTSRLFPGRSVLHVSEAVALYMLMGNYALAVGNPDQADVCLQLLEDIAPDHPCTAVLEGRLMRHAMEEAVRRLVAEGTPPRRASAPRRRAPPGKKRAGGRRDPGAA